VREWLVVLLFLWTWKGASQGLVVFNNRVGEQVVAPVYNVDPANPAYSQYGNGIVYNGGFLVGPGFTAQLFGGPANTPVMQLPPLVPTTVFRSDVGGYVVQPNRAVAVPGVPQGEPAKVQLRAWNNRGGSITNWAQVVADPTIPRGASLPITTPPLGSLFTAPPNLVGLESFSLALPITLNSLRRQPDGQFQFNYINPTVADYCVHASEDLVHWTSLEALGLGSGTFIDTSATNKARRFYRIVTCR